MLRKINPDSFQLANRNTSREINRQIALTLIRARQPISRADLAREMNTHRAVVTLLANELLAEGLIIEGATGEAKRGRKPTFLYIDSRERYVLAVDIRATRTFIQTTDMVGKPLDGLASFPTPRDAQQFIEELTARLKGIMAGQNATCQGVGVVVPGMVEAATGRILHAPTLDWRDVALREPLEIALGLPVYMENSGRACALAQVWATRYENNAPGTLAFVSVSDGVGVGIVVNGETLRGKHNIAGEFGHVPLSIDGPRCACGARGCWEAYISNLATLSRYFGRGLTEQILQPAETATFTVADLIALARRGDGKAITSLHSTGRYLGLGLASIINAIDPAVIYLSGEITAVWDLLEATVKAAIAERTVTKFAATTEIKIVANDDSPRLRGAAALVTAPAFAAPRVA